VTAKKDSKPRSKGKKTDLREVDGMERMSQAKSEKVDWLIRNVLPANAVSIIEGRKTAGKSTVLAAIAACYTGGPAIPGWEGPRDGGVVWLAKEDPWSSVVKPRIEVAGGNTDRVFRIQVPQGSKGSRLPYLPIEISLIEELMLLNGSRLLIMDPLPSLCARGDMLLSEAGCREILDPLNDLCDRLKVTVIAGRHLKKGYRGMVIDAGYGHGAFGNAARSIMRVDLHPHDSGRRLWSVVACNWATCESVTQSFELETIDQYAAIKWTGSSPLSAQQIADGDGDEQQRDEWSDAELVLVAKLASGFVPYAEVESEADDAGVSRSAIRRAGIKLGIAKRRIGYGAKGHWEWGPPPKGFPPALVDKLKSMGGAQKSDINDMYGKNRLNPSDMNGKNAHRSPKVSPTSDPPLEDGKDNEDHGD
jgi:hypothetical protein